MQVRVSKGADYRYIPFIIIIFFTPGSIDPRG